MKELAAFSLIQKVLNDPYYHKLNPPKNTGVGTLPKWQLIKVLQDSHVFVFNASASKWVGEHAKENFEAMLDPTVSLPEKVEALSLPFATTLFIESVVKEDAVFASLLFEQSPETVSAVYFLKTGKAVLPIYFPSILNSGIAMAEGESPEESERLAVERIKNVMNDKTQKAWLQFQLGSTVRTMAYVDAISVKRIGIERTPISLYDKQGGVRRKFKSENVYHIAGKVEYEKVVPLDSNAQIDWTITGFWRGHWRAFYKQDSSGGKVKDEYGRNVVDYSRTGKDRAGEYHVKGYTWVTEHTKGPMGGVQKKMHRVNPSRGTKYLFSYGSNHKAQLEERMERSVELFPAYAENMKRIYVGWSNKWGGAVASLKKLSGKTTYGNAVEVTEADLKKLDVYEGIHSGNYKRSKVKIKAYIKGKLKTIDAVVYIATSTREDQPSVSYLKAVAKNVSHFWKNSDGKKPTWKDFQP